jgi:Tol biopolymer transport system component
VIDVNTKGLEFLSNETIEGGSLAERLEQGGLPDADALRYAIEIGSALHRAHRRGAIHGKLSAHAILLTASGARILRPVEGTDLDALPYRAPEQVAGGAPDWRSDIFSFGALLYEMVSGRRAFSGEGAALDRAIVERPPATLLGKSPIHAAMEGVIAGCMEKDPAQRRQRVQNAVTELKLAGRSLPRLVETPRQPAAQFHPQPAAGYPQPQAESRSLAGEETEIRPKRPRIFTPVRFPDEIQAVPRSARRQRQLLWSLLLVSALFMASGAWIAWQYLHPTPGQVFKFAPLPETAVYRMPAISPDGRYVAVQAAGPDGKPMLWLRALDAQKPTMIPGTEGGFAPFWSPDSGYIAFFAGKALKKVPLTGGPAAKICDAEPLPGGGSWNRAGTILFAPGQGGTLYQVSADGGKPQPLFPLNKTRFERAHLWPQFLPDGKHFVFFVLSDSPDATGVYTGSLDSADYTKLFQSVTNAVYSPPAVAESGSHGYLVYIRDRSLMGVGFNASRLKLTGDPIPLQDDVGAVQSLSLAPVSVSGNAILVYQSVGSASRQLSWMDRSGKPLVPVSEGGSWGPPRIAPDGSRAVVAKLDPDKKKADLWMVDEAGNATLFAGGPAHKASPVWSPYGWRIAYFSSLEGNYEIAASPAAAGTKVETLFKSEQAAYPTDWSHDGKYLFFNVTTEASKSDIWALSVAARHAGPLLDTVYSEGWAALSPDGRWLAFQTDEMGRYQVYVQPFDGISDGTKRRYDVSTEAGGGLPRWRADGKELFYMTNSGLMMSVTVHPESDEFKSDTPQPLFQTRPIPNTWNLYDVSPDGQRFLMNLPLEWPNASPITVMSNWTEKVQE